MYIIYRQEYSQLAQKIHGNPIVWPIVTKIRQSPPRDEVSFRVWLWDLVKKHGPGIYRVVRTQAKCLPRNALILCNSDVKTVQDVAVSDFVLSDDGFYHKVMEVSERQYEGYLVEITPSVFNLPLKVTTEHKVLCVKPKRCGVGKNYVCRPTYGGCHIHIQANQKYRERWLKYQKVQKLALHQLTNDAIAEKLGLCKEVVRRWRTHQSRGGHPRSTTSCPIYENYKPTWVEAKELEEGDFVLFPIPRRKQSLTFFELDKLLSNVIVENGFVYRKTLVYRAKKPSRHSQSHPIPNKVEITPDLMRLFGYYVAEGHSSSNGINLSFSPDEENYAIDVKKIVKDAFNLDVRVHKAHYCLSAEFCSSLLAQLFHVWFGKNAHTKKVPYWMLFLPEHLVIEFLKGYWRGDGSVYNKGGYLVLRASTVSKSLLFQLVIMLLRLRIIPAICIKRQSLKSFSKGAPICHINVGHGSSELAQIFGFNLFGKKRGKWKSKAFIWKGFLWLPIRRIRKLPFKGTVYNFEVDDSKSYVANMILTHNSERAGFHPVFYGYVDEEHIDVQRRYPQYTSHPGLPPSRQLYYKAPKRKVGFYKRPRHVG